MTDIRFRLLRYRYFLRLKWNYCCLSMQEIDGPRGRDLGDGKLWTLPKLIWALIENELGSPAHE